MEELKSKLKDTFNIVFASEELLTKALTHGSFVNESQKGKSYERLEFLGDSVVSTAVSTALFTLFPDCDEGELTKMRSRLVNKETLASLACELELGGALVLGRGEEKGGGRENPTILAACFEALVGAVYLDSGYSPAEAFVKVLFEPILASKSFDTGYFDHKPELQERAQREFKEPPVYEVTGESGPSHEKVFTVSVSVGGKLFGSGKGTSKKKAEQEAARVALEKMKG